MKLCINLNQLSPQRRQWLWFIALWCGGLAGALLLALPVKILIHFLK